MVNVILISVAGAFAVAGFEWLHARRILRMRFLAFGPAGRPRRWVGLVPAARALAVLLAVFGTLLLLDYQPAQPRSFFAAQASRRLLVCLDVSPSMYTPDAGPEPDRITRAARAGELVEQIVNRIPFAETRASIVGFYTRALPIVIDTQDPAVVINAAQGLPMYKAFDAGESNMGHGLTQAMTLARSWAARSATLVVISDGDVTLSDATFQRPPSIADVIVLGVGDTQKATMISGHASRQDAASLKLVATRLGGRYINASSVNIPPQVFAGLHAAPPRDTLPWSTRELGIASLAIGATLLAGIGPLLAWCGRPTSAPAAPSKLPAASMLALNRRPS